MISLTKDELLQIVGGWGEGPHDRLSFTGVEFDSRQIKGGELFVALKGEKSHGHEFLGEAFKRGAALFLVEDPALKDCFEEPQRLVIVHDTLEAFSTLASWWRHELALPVLAVTGSVGKTTVKEMVAGLLLKHSPGTFSLRSHNNHVGVPYTLCRLSSTHKWAVVEMGMNHAGEIRQLSRIVEPDVAAVTAIAPAHIEFLGSIEAIADAKFEILQGLKKGGTLVLDAHCAQMQQALLRHDPQGVLKVRSFGCRPGAEVFVRDVQTLELEGIRFTLVIDGKELQIEMSMPGEHNALNAACAVLAARSLVPDLSLEQIERGLREFRAPLMRMNLKEFSDGRQLIDDSYNANPSSMRASLELAGQLSRSGRKVGLILGDMLELGSHAARYHSEAGELVARSSPVFVIAVGQFSELLLSESRTLGIPVFAAASPEAAAHTARKLDFDVLLVKASRGVALDKAVNILMDKNGGEQ